MTKKFLNARVPIELWNMVEDGWMQERKKDRTLTKEQYLERLLKAGLKAEGEK